MKKIITHLSFIIFLFILISCSKKNGSGSNCYRCTITGTSTRTLDTCSNVESSQYSFQDANGNAQSFVCEEK